MKRDPSCVTASGAGRSNNGAVNLNKVNAMPKAADFFPSNYLRCADLGGKERVVTIDRVTTDVFENDGRKQAKPIVHFKDDGIKPLVSNKPTSC